MTTLESVTYQQPKIDAQGNPVVDASGKPVQEDVTTRTQTLAMGPIASQESIKELGHQRRRIRECEFRARL